MKKIVLIFIALLAFNFTIKAQTNLVPNPSFEIFDTCPDNLGQISRANGWFSSKPSPDYFNSCANSSDWSYVPSNYWGYQIPASGLGYAGFTAKVGQFNIREYLSIQLNNSLQIGAKYFVSMKVCLAFNPNFGSSDYCGINKLGALFSTNIYSDIENAPICNCPQFYSSSIISDTLNWTMIKGSFVADSIYKFINIGNFFTDSMTDSLQITGNFCQTYYYLDDVCVSIDSIFAFNYLTNLNTNLVLSDQKGIFYPNPTENVLNIESELVFNELRIYNLKGGLEFIHKISFSKKYSQDISNLKSGSYYIIVLNNDKIISKKIILKL